MNETIVFGASGQLGHCIKVVCERLGITDIVFPAEDAANILDLEKLEKLFVDYQPAYIINCAAYTAVDKAEDDVDLARKINKDGAANIAKLCKQYGAALIHCIYRFCI
jgi:dTDP-4-dehydrorhamnose reductase